MKNELIALCTELRYNERGGPLYRIGLYAVARKNEKSHGFGFCNERKTL